MIMVEVTESTPFIINEKIAGSPPEGTARIDNTG